MDGAGPTRLKRRALLAVKHTSRTLSVPPSTRASIAMDGGVADTTWLYTGRYSAEGGRSWDASNTLGVLLAAPDALC